jgi:hypothetical protein
VVELEGGGERGLGYTYSHAAAAAVVESLLAPLVEGADPMAPPRVWVEMRRAVRNVGVAGIAAMATAAVDIALWDLRARLLGLSLADSRSDPTSLSWSTRTEHSTAARRSVRRSSMSVSTVANWAANFLVSTFFLTLTGAISIEGTFWLYAGFGVAAIVFFALRLPETKNRSLEEISEEVTDEAVET